MRNFKNRFRILLLFGILFFVTSVVAVLAQPWQRRNKVDLGAFIKEIVSIKVSGNETQSAIWLPFEFNIEANRTIEGKSREQIEKN